MHRFKELKEAAIDKDTLASDIMLTTLGRCKSLTKRKKSTSSPNYTFVFLGLLVRCVLSSPALLFGATAGVCAALKVHAEVKEVVFKFLLVAVASAMALPVMCATGSGTALLWSFVDDLAPDMV